ncbi:hypothetical protein [Mycoplasma sp. SG1]|uniref:hypothetical protein n=1 Tax=Mycoplasma sp. SG1 TaxID=2810348 RepID=UPI002023D8D6|nr:hypothetical protein [Mycoplasma sp. SG1]URM52789.1 hypothetical protein JRW51_00380 [Mycoplasma sp. SG1]
MKHLLKLQKFIKFLYFLFYALIFIVLVLSIYSLINTYVVSKLNNLWVLLLIYVASAVIILFLYIIIKMIDFIIYKKDQKINNLSNQLVVEKLQVNWNKLLQKDGDQKINPIFNVVDGDYQTFKPIFENDNSKPIFILANKGSGRTTFLKKILEENRQKFYFIVVDARTWKYGTSSLNNSQKFLSYFDNIPKKFGQNKNSIVKSSLSAARIAIDVILTTLVKSKSADFKTNERIFPIDNSDINVKNIHEIIQSYNKLSLNNICFLIDHLDDLPENNLFDICSLIDYFFAQPNSKFKFVITYNKAQLKKIKTDNSLSLIRYIGPVFDLKDKTDWLDFVSKYVEDYTLSVYDKNDFKNFLNYIKTYHKENNKELSYLSVITIIDDYLLFSTDFSNSKINAYFTLKKTLIN